MRAWAVCLLAAACGCLSTHHVEYRRAATTGIDPDGRRSYSGHAAQDERHWFGPWPAQPDRARP